MSNHGEDFTHGPTKPPKQGPPKKCMIKLWGQTCGRNYINCIS